MDLLPEWEMDKQGVICGVIGIVVLLMLIPLLKGLHDEISSWTVEIQKEVECLKRTLTKISLHNLNAVSSQFTTEK